MKKICLLVILTMSLAGCNGLKRLVDGEESHPKPQPILLGDQPTANKPPNFGLPIPEGYTRTVYYGILSNNGNVPIVATHVTKLDVFIKEGGQIQTWFRIGNTYSEAFYYTFDGTTSVVTYRGNFIAGKEFCIYQYVLK